LSFLPFRGERNGSGRREKRPEKIRETGETTLKNREKGEPAWKGRRENIIFLKLVIICLDIPAGTSNKRRGRLF